jgi:hypothetical protein
MNKEEYVQFYNVRCSPDTRKISVQVLKKFEESADFIGTYYMHSEQMQTIRDFVRTLPPVEYSKLSGKKLKINNSRINDWLKKALKEHHSEEINYRKNAVNELITRKTMFEKRLSRLYDDFLDEKIKKVFYDSKFEEYNREIKEIDESMRKHSEEKTKYFELGINFYEISQRAPELFDFAKMEDKRKLISLIFKKITLDSGLLNYEYNEGFNVLVKAIREVNGSKQRLFNKTDSKIFEPVKIGSNKRKTGSFNPGFDELLADPV